MTHYIMYDLIKRLPVPHDLTTHITQFVGRPFTAELLERPLNKYAYCVYGYLYQYFSVFDLPNGTHIEDSIWNVDMIQLNIYQDDIDNFDKLIVSES